MSYINTKLIDDVIRLSREMNELREVASRSTCKCSESGTKIDTSAIEDKLSSFETRMNDIVASVSSMESRIVAAEARLATFDEVRNSLNDVQSVSQCAFQSASELNAKLDSLVVSDEIIDKVVARVQQLDTSSKSGKKMLKTPKQDTTPSTQGALQI